MYLPSISLSYFFLAVAIIAIAAYLYFRLLIVKSSPDNSNREKIIGNMKDPESWRERNRKMSYVCIFWFVVSIAAFAYLKFLYSVALIPIIYLIIYAVLIVLSLIFFPRTKKKASA
ncbi:hypothetical protein N4T77_12045 [Clostridium sp. CX1]|uniref:hypothetical protein n=1 Tax=Clostridium sp. CX1 TaxID=2978346 RepID=UPI0021C16DC0|nr:hypothetical protein [Clostridium sp. CX1]MCT8977332.1 hypothetical protein [Clostridium sp. CX1]